MQNTESISFVMAFVSGIFIFLSPCIFPIIPAYISYLTGISFNEISEKTTKEERRRIRAVTALHALSFILGFSIVFILLGLSATFLGKLLFQYQPILKKIGGVFIIFFALIIMGAIKIPFLLSEKKISYRKGAVSFFGSVLVGATFAAAWTPCVGPILGSILIYASSTESIGTGFKLLIAFSLGLGFPFFFSALAINSLLVYVKKIGKYLRWIAVTTGVFLMVFGVLLIIGR
ncbi:MAG: cytochrome c biogenesis protein CcdA [Candidatus Omnitrophota bacterium]